MGIKQVIEIKRILINNNVKKSADGLYTVVFTQKDPAAVAKYSLLFIEIMQQAFLMGQVLSIQTYFSGFTVHGVRFFLSEHLTPEQQRIYRLIDDINNKSMVINGQKLPMMKINHEFLRMN